VKIKQKTEFWWPGFGAEVTRFCRSCDICQRTIIGGNVASVLLEKMPIIDTPFDRVTVDLVAPVYPPTDKGNWYIKCTAGMVLQVDMICTFF